MTSLQVILGGVFSIGLSFFLAGDILGGYGAFRSIRLARIYRAIHRNASSERQRELDEGVYSFTGSKRWPNTVKLIEDPLGVIIGNSLLAVLIVLAANWLLGWQFALATSALSIIWTMKWRNVYTIQAGMQPLSYLRSWLEEDPPPKQPEPFSSMALSAFRIYATIAAVYLTIGVPSLTLHVLFGWRLFGPANSFRGLPTGYQYAGWLVLALLELWIVLRIRRSNLLKKTMVRYKPVILDIVSAE